MIRTLVDRFDDNTFQLFLFGPGPGESIVFRAPPNTWGVIDSCKGVGDQASICPPVDLLDAADEKADVVVFTHPHHDHASGMDRLVNEYTRGVVGCLPYYLHPDGKEPRWLIPRG